MVRAQGNRSQAAGDGLAYLERFGTFGGQRRSEGYFEMKEGLLYPALHRMEQDGLLKSEWRSVAGSRRRKYYFITEEGRKVLVNSVAEWTAFTEKLMRVIKGHGLVEPESVPG